MTDSLEQVERLLNAAGKEPSHWVVLDLYREGVRYWRRWTVILGFFLFVSWGLFLWTWWMTQ
jgi:hypothetical protein